jgi:hypothetical protein
MSFWNTIRDFLGGYPSAPSSLLFAIEPAGWRGSTRESMRATARSHL